jgi:hypothetical protein
MSRFSFLTLPPACGMTLLYSELAFATRTMRKAIEQGGSFRFVFLSAFSVPRSRHPRPSDARSPSQNPLRASQEVRTPAPKQVWVPFRRFYPVALGVGRDGTPSGQACTASRWDEKAQSSGKTRSRRIFYGERYVGE